MRFFAASAAQRTRMSTERATLYLDTKEWKDSTKPFDMKPHCFLVALDFDLSAAAPLKLSNEAKVLAAFLNGQPADAARLTGTAGRNRLLLKLLVNDNRNASMPFPILVRLQPETGTLTYLPVVP